MEKLDYSPVYNALKRAELNLSQDDSEEDIWIKITAIEDAVGAFNRENGTDFDPVRVRHQYLELCEMEPNPSTLEQTVQFIKRETYVCLD